jgi:hypothetical protein
MDFPPPSVAKSKRASAIEDAERALELLSRSLGDKADGHIIETDARSLRGLARVIVELLDETRLCGGIDCMGRMIDGHRFWVTNDRLDLQKKRTERAEDALRQIVTMIESGADRFELLVDWQGLATTSGAIARAALTRRPPPAPREDQLGVAAAIVPESDGAVPGKHCAGSGRGTC